MCVLCIRTFRQDCPAHISLKVDDEGRALQVRSLCTEHNHELSKVISFTEQFIYIVLTMVCILPVHYELFKHLPQQRKLPAEVKEKAARLLCMKANKKLIQQEISKETGKVVLLKDICNIATAARQGRSRNNLDATVQTLMDKYGTYSVHMHLCSLPLCCYRC